MVIALFRQLLTACTRAPSDQLTDQTGVYDQQICCCFFFLVWAYILLVSLLFFVELVYFIFPNSCLLAYVYMLGWKHSPFEGFEDFVHVDDLNNCSWGTTWWIAAIKNSCSSFCWIIILPVILLIISNTKAKTFEWPMNHYSLPLEYATRIRVKPILVVLHLKQWCLNFCHRVGACEACN